MRSGKLLLSGLLITGCVGLVAGCSSAPKKKPQMSKREAVKTEYIVRHAPKKTAQTTRTHKMPADLPLKKQVQQQNQNSEYLARKNEQARARLKYQREWAEKQELAAQRAKYQQKWEQKQKQNKWIQTASLKSNQQYVQSQKRAQQQRAVQQAKRRQYHQQWQQQQQRNQQQAKQRRYQQQYQQAQVSRQRHVVRAVGYGGRSVGNYSAPYLGGDFAGNPELLRFIDRMSARHGFSKSYLNGVFSRTRNRDSVARLWAGNNGGASSGGRGWYNYRSKFVTPANTQKGVQFWNKHHAHLQRASQRYGVDPEYIVGIMGVETRWGRILGKHKVIDALTTSAIVNKRRSKFFFKELENYLLMTRSERMDPLQPKGSYAGAMGYGQFMPSSFRAFAVDFNGDGVRDLWNPVDAIGSIANYFAKHGWKYGQKVAVPAKVSSMAYTAMPDG